MKLIDKLDSDRIHVSFEISPPPFERGREKAFEIFDKLIVYNPDFISITYHREIIRNVPIGNNKFKRVIEKPKAGTIPLCALLEGHYDIPVIQHLLCGGFTREETAYALKEMAYVNLENIFALRGDPVIANGEKEFTPEENGHKYASELVEQIASFNKGEHILNGVQDQIKTNFCIGVAGYPEKHHEAPNKEFDIIKLKEKVDKGAHYIITQMFYDNKTYFNFVKNAREIGITVPIIPGLNPIITANDIVALPRVFHIDVPKKLVDEIYSNSSIKEVSIEWLTQQVKGLLKFGVPDLHFFTEGRDSKIDILGEVYHRVFG